MTIAGRRCVDWRATCGHGLHTLVCYNFGRAPKHLWCVGPKDLNLALLVCKCYAGRRCADSTMNWHQRVAC